MAEYAELERLLSRYLDGSLSQEELARLAHETGWELMRVVWEGGYMPGDFIGILERR